MEKEIKERAERAIAEHVFPGCVIGILKNHERTILSFGTLIYRSGEAVTENTIYDLASITKSIPLASLALTFIEEGRLRLDDKVVEYLPELRNDHGATIEDLLRYRVHGPRMSTLSDKAPDEIGAYIFEHGFDCPPGESVYANLPAFLLGIVLERVGNDTLENLGRKFFFDPLRMNETTFFPKSPDTLTVRYSAKLVGETMREIAPTEIVEGEEICGIPHDESARIFAKAGRAVGHAGLFSTANDLLNFLESMFSNVGDTISHILKGAEQGLGWELHQKWMGNHRSELFGKSGFTGTVVMCDAERKLALVILSNRTYPRRPLDSSAIHSFRADIADIVFAYE